MANSFKNLEYLSLKQSKFDSSGLNIIISAFSKLKYLEITNLNDDGYLQLMNSRMSLPNLVNLIVDSSFNDAEEFDGMSIKPQLYSLTLRNFNMDYKPKLKSLSYQNLKELFLMGVSANSSIFPVGLKLLSLTDCNLFLVDFGRISESLEELIISRIRINEVSDFVKSNFENLKKFTIYDSNKKFWYDFRKNISEWTTLKLECLRFSCPDIDYCELITNICYLDLLTSLEISHSPITSPFLVHLFKGIEYNNLTTLNINSTLSDGEFIPIIDKMTSLKYLNLSSNSQLEYSDREMFCKLENRMIRVNCEGTFLRIPDKLANESDISFLNSIDTGKIIETQSNDREAINSFNVDKNIRIVIKEILDITYSSVRYSDTLDTFFVIECTGPCSNNEEVYKTKTVQGLNNLQWNEEIIINSMISQISCDYTINFSLIAFTQDPMTRLSNRREICHFYCPVFNSNLELVQGNVKLHEQPLKRNSNISLLVEFPQYESNIKYDIDREPPCIIHTPEPLFKLIPFELMDRKVVNSEQVDGKDLKVEDPLELLPFLCGISYGNSWNVYTAKQYISKWKKPHILYLITLFSSSFVGIFSKMVVIEILGEISDEIFGTILPYLVHCLKYENTGILIDYLFLRTLKSKIFTNQLFWLLKVESNSGPNIRKYIEKYMSVVNKEDIEIIRNQCLFFDSIEDLNSPTQFNQLFLPFTLIEIKQVLPVKKRTNFDKTKEFELVMVNEEKLLMRYYANSIDIFRSFVFSNFISISKIAFFEHVDNLPRTDDGSSFEYGVTGYSKGFVTTPPGMKHVQTAKQRIEDLQLLKENFFSSMIYDHFIRNIFSLHSSDLIIQMNHQGIVAQRDYFLGYNLSTFVIQTKIDNIFGSHFWDFLQINNLQDQFKIIIEKFLQVFEKNQYVINYFLKPFMRDIRRVDSNTFTFSLEKVKKILE